MFNAVHSADPDPKVLAYQYLQALPQIAAGSANKLWIIPAEMTKALEGIGGALTGLLPGGGSGVGLLPPVTDDETPSSAIDEALEAARVAAEETEKEATAGLRGLTAGTPVSASSLLETTAEREHER